VSLKQDFETVREVLDEHIAVAAGDEATWAPSRWPEELEDTRKARAALSRIEEALLFYIRESVS
jgi:hypothetical protein